MPQINRLYTAGQGTGTSQNRRIAINTQGANNASLPALQVFTSTSEVAFTDPAVANAYPMALAIPPGGPCEQEKFTVVFSGYIKTGQSSTIVFKLRLGDSATVTSNTLLVTTASATVGTTTVPFEVEISMVYDSVSGKLDIGAVSQAINAVVTAPTIGSAPFAPTVPISNTNNPVLVFTLTATFGTGSSGTSNSINLKDFGINH
jgi:hypothetical protein